MIDSLSPSLAPSLPICQGALRRRYEHFPYPGYPLWAKIRWQEGYLSSPQFAAEVAGTLPWRKRGGAKVLVLGCGDTFAAGFNAWLNGADHADYVDFSARSLRRSRWRTALGRAGHRYHLAAIEDFIAAAKAGSYHHIEAFGVLHHCPDPAAILRGCARLLVPGGTMRLMVYNSPARRRIHAIQDVAGQKGWLTAERPPVAELRRWLGKLAATVPGFEGYGPLSRRPAAELVDALVNPLEHRLAPSAWRQMIAAAGLEVAGQLDRHGELAHLENPLSAPPDGAALDRLAQAGILCQNLEFYLLRPERPTVQPGQAEQFPSQGLWQDALRWGLRRWQSPAASPAGSAAGQPWQRRQQWRRLIDYLSFGLRPKPEAYAGLSARELGQLARRGWLLPAMVGEKALALRCQAPLAASAPAPAEPPYCPAAFARFCAKPLSG